MMHHFHAVVSIDHAEATVFEFAENDVSNTGFRRRTGRAISTTKPDRLVPVTRTIASHT